MNYNAATLPPNVIRCMNPADRKAVGVQPPDEIQVGIDVAAEKVLQRDCENWLRLHGVEALHLSHRAREKSGWPDLTFAIDGRPYAVELKTATGRLSTDQERVLSRLKANGWQTAVVRSLPGFLELLQGRWSEAGGL